jgi:hypothetical protein
MSTRLRKEEPTLPDPHDTETAKIVRLETATETMMAYIGYLNTEIMKEEDEPKSNQLKVQALQEQMDAVSRERKAIVPDNEKLIAKALYVYAPIVKALDA